MSKPNLPDGTVGFSECPGCRKLFTHDGTEESELAFGLATKLHAAECRPLIKMGWNEDAEPIFVPEGWTVSDGD